MGGRLGAGVTCGLSLHETFAALGKRPPAWSRRTTKWWKRRCGRGPVAQRQWKQPVRPLPPDRCLTALLHFMPCGLSGKRIIARFVSASGLVEYGLEVPLLIVHALQLHSCPGSNCKMHTRSTVQCPGKHGAGKAVDVISNLATCGQC